MRRLLPSLLVLALALPSRGQESVDFLRLPLERGEPEVKCAALELLGGWRFESGEVYEEARALLERTLRDVDPVVRARAHRVLAHGGTWAHSVSPWHAAQGLADASPRVRRASASALQVHGGSVQRFAPKLLALSRDPVRSVREAAAEAYAAVEHPVERHAQVRALMRRGGPRERVFALEVLEASWQDFESELEPDVVSALDDADGEVRERAGRLAIRALRAGQELPAEALRSLRASRDPYAPFLRAALGDPERAFEPDPLERHVDLYLGRHDLDAWWGRVPAGFACEVLDGERGNPKLAEHLEAAFERGDEPEQLRVLVFLILAAQLDARWDPLLERALVSPRVDVRGGAVLALRGDGADRLGKVHAFPRLQGQWWSLAATRGLTAGVLGGGPLQVSAPRLRLLRRAIADPALEVRLEAAGAVFELGGETGGASALRALEDPAPGMRIHAFQWLSYASHDRPARVARLLRCAWTDPAVRELALGASHVEDPRLRRLALAILRGDPNPERRAEAAMLLGVEMAGPHVSALVEACEDADPAVRVAALGGLARAGPEDRARAARVAGLAAGEEGIVGEAAHAALADLAKRAAPGTYAWAVPLAYSRWLALGLLSFVLWLRVVRVLRRRPGKRWRVSAVAVPAAASFAAVAYVLSRPWAAPLLPNAWTAIPFPPAAALTVSALAGGVALWTCLPPPEREG